MSRFSGSAETVRATYPESCPICSSILSPVTRHCWKEPGSIFAASFLGLFRFSPFRTLIRSSLSLLVSRAKHLSLLSLSSKERCFSSLMIFMTLSWNLSSMCSSLVLGSSEPNAALQVKDHLLCPADKTPKAVQDACHDLQGFVCKADFLLDTCMCRCLGRPFLRGRTLCSSLAELLGLLPWQSMALGGCREKHQVVALFRRDLVLL